MASIVLELNSEPSSASRVATIDEADGPHISFLRPFLHWYTICAVGTGTTVNLYCLFTLVRCYRRLRFRPHLFGVVLSNSVYLCLLASHLIIRADYLSDHFCRAYLYLTEVFGDLPSLCMLAVSVEQCATIWSNPYARVKANNHKRRQIAAVAVVTLVVFVANSWIIPMAAVGSGVDQQCTLDGPEDYRVENIMATAKIFLVDFASCLIMIACHGGLIYKLHRPFRVTEVPHSSTTPSTSTRAASPLSGRSSPNPSRLTNRFYSYEGAAFRKGHRPTHRGAIPKITRSFDDIGATLNGPAVPTACSCDNFDACSRLSPIAHRRRTHSSSKSPNSSSPSLSTPSRPATSAGTSECESISHAARQRPLSQKALNTRRKTVLQLILVISLIMVLNLPKHIIEVIQRLSAISSYSEDETEALSNIPISPYFLCATYVLHLFQFVIIALYVRLPLFRTKFPRMRIGGQQGLLASNHAIATEFYMRTARSQAGGEGSCENLPRQKISIIISAPHAGKRRKSIFTLYEETGSPIRRVCTIDLDDVAQVFDKKGKQLIQRQEVTSEFLRPEISVTIEMEKSSFPTTSDQNSSPFKSLPMGGEV